MKKIKFSILAVFLVCVMVFAGCTKASTATIETCNNLYATQTEKYGTDENNQTKVFDVDGFVDLYSHNSYASNKLYNYIATTSEDGSMYVYNVLKKDGEYDAIMQAISKFYLSFNKSDFTTELNKVPQKQRTNLYNAIDDLSNYLKDVVNKKEALEYTIGNFDDPMAVPVQQALKTFLLSYQQLIDKFYKISVCFEVILNNYIYPVTTKSQVALGGVERLVKSCELYFARYYYLKHMALYNNYDVRFASEKLLDEETNTYVENANYDESFKKFVEILGKEIAEVAANDTDKIFYYGAALTKLEALKTNIVNYEKAVNYLNKNTKVGEKIKKDTIAYQYVQFMENFDLQVADFQQYLLTNLL